MIETILKFVETTLLPLGFWGVFGASIIEEVIAPIPSQIVIMSAGFTFLSGNISDIDLWLNLLWYVIIPVSVGGTIGSLFIYYLVYYLGKPFIDKWGKLLGLSWDDVERIREKYKDTKLDEYLIFGLKVFPIIPNVAIAAFAGITRIPVRVYFLYSVLGTAIRAGALGLLAWKAGDLYIEYASQVKAYEKWVWLVIILIIVIYISYKIRKKHFKK